MAVGRSDIGSAGGGTGALLWPLKVCKQRGKLGQKVFHGKVEYPATPDNAKQESKGLRDSD